MSGVYDLAKAATPIEGQEAHEFTGAFVTSVNGDGTVALNYLGEVHPYVEALASYMDRHIGDLVLVRSMGDHWTVIGRVGDAFAIQFPPEPTVPPPHQHPYKDIQGPPPTVTWGLTDPTPITGWNVVITGVIWAHNDGRIYMKAGTGTPPPGTTPPDPPYTPPPTAPPTVNYFNTTAVAPYLWNGTVLAKNTSTYWPQGYNGISDSNYPRFQSLATGAWGTLFTYGTALRTFITANKANIKSVEMKFIRSTVTHGYQGSLPDLGEQPQLWTTDFTSPPASIADADFYGVDFYNPWYGPALKKGETGWWQWELPVMLDHFSTGQTSNSILTYTPSGYDFSLWVPDSGQIKITMK